MKQTRADSHMQIWSTNYIDSIDARYPEDQGLKVIQIEPTGCHDDYIVEVVKKEDE